MVYNLLVTITTTGTRQALKSTREPASWVSLQAGPDNAEDIFHGGPEVTILNGEAMSAGSGGGPPQYPPVSDISMYELTRMYVVGTAGDLVRVRYGKR